MAGDLEGALTRRVWTDDVFAQQLERDPVGALESLGVEVPAGLKVKVVLQRRDRIYFTIPPARPPGSAPPAAPLNQIDLWSSKGLFVWLVPVAAKFKLLALRDAARKLEGRA